MTKRPMEQKLEARNRPTNIRLPDKGAASFQWGEDRLFNKWSWINWVPDGKNESCPLTHSIHKYQLQIIRAFNAEDKTTMALPS